MRRRVRSILAVETDRGGGVIMTELISATIYVVASLIRWRGATS
jgi:hypothetical protein